jgi:hypothetical protein
MKPYDVKADSADQSLHWTVVRFFPDDDALPGEYALCDAENTIRGSFTGADSLALYLAYALQEVDRLRGIVDQRPVTADGVVVVPGMMLWYWIDGPTKRLLASYKLHIHHTESTLTEMDGWKHFYDCYSTRAAAEAAASKGEGT